jgi:hypothetical protein
MRSPFRPCSWTCKGPSAGLIGINPCGMVVDMLHVPIRAPMNFFDDTYQGIPITWYPCQKGAKDLPYASAFGSTNWEDEYQKFATVGEDGYARRRSVWQETPKITADGQGPPCGTPTQWANGFHLNTFSGVTYDPLGIPTCCGESNRDWGGGMSDSSATVASVVVLGGGMVTGDSQPGVRARAGMAMGAQNRIVNVMRAGLAMGAHLESDAEATLKAGLALGGHLRKGDVQWAAGLAMGARMRPGEVTWQAGVKLGSRSVTYPVYSWHAGLSLGSRLSPGQHEWQAGFRVGCHAIMSPEASLHAGLSLGAKLTQTTGDWRAGLTLGAKFGAGEISSLHAGFYLGCKLEQVNADDGRAGFALGAKGRFATIDSLHAGLSLGANAEFTVPP